MSLPTVEWHSLKPDQVVVRGSLQSGKCNRREVENMKDTGSFSEDGFSTIQPSEDEGKEDQYWGGLAGYNRDLGAALHSGSPGCWWEKAQKRRHPQHGSNCGSTSGDCSSPERPV